MSLHHHKTGGGEIQKEISWETRNEINSMDATFNNADVRIEGNKVVYIGRDCVNGISFLHFYILIL